MVANLVTQEELRLFREDLLKEIHELIGSAKTNETRDYLRSNEACRLLQVSVGTLHNLRNKKTLPFTKIGGVVYYHRDDIKRLMSIKNKA